ncbi:hypothetical protein GCM10010123_15330 [Pilimelia anulata]|uniref:Uncharacterized protein n=1 Tax=Pilimelia anulata TaxID=53371 RepID=A0A8J3B9F0_9ACTN|nr:hypothetical protein [Pilimelia anulata]GGJ86697.1 hypothetical protein GCM10010123_15330 [Pilimelia anulata]
MRRVRSAAGWSAAATLLTLVLSAAPASAAGTDVRITQAPRAVRTGGTGAELAAVLRRTSGGTAQVCQRIRWTLEARVSGGLAVGDLQVRRVEGDRPTLINVRRDGNLLRLADQSDDIRRLCRRGTVTTRYRISATGATGGSVAVTVSAVDRQDEQLGRANRTVTVNAAGAARGAGDDGAAGGAAGADGAAGANGGAPAGNGNRNAAPPPGAAPEGAPPATAPVAVEPGGSTTLPAGTLPDTGSSVFGPGGSPVAAGSRTGLPASWFATGGLLLVVGAGLLLAFYYRRRVGAAARRRPGPGSRPGAAPPTGGAYGANRVPGRQGFGSARGAGQRVTAPTGAAAAWASDTLRTIGNRAGQWRDRLTDSGPGGLGGPRRY